MAGRVRPLTSDPSKPGTQQPRDAVMRRFCRGGKLMKERFALKIGTHLVSVAPRWGRLESAFISAATLSATASPSGTSESE